MCIPFFVARKEHVQVSGNTGTAITSGQFRKQKNTQKSKPLCLIRALTLTISSSFCILSEMIKTVFASATLKLGKCVKHHHRAECETIFQY